MQRVAALSGHLRPAAESTPTPPAGVAAGRVPAAGVGRAEAAGAGRAAAAARVGAAGSAAVVEKEPLRVHIVCGDVMIVTNHISFDHDVQYAMRRILQWIDEVPDRKLVGTCSSDYSDLDKWLEHAHILISYCSGPVADAENTAVLQRWLEGGGRMIG